MTLSWLSPTSISSLLTEENSTLSVAVERDHRAHHGSEAAGSTRTAEIVSSIPQRHPGFVNSAGGFRYEYTCTSAIAMVSDGVVAVGSVCQPDVSEEAICS